MLAMDLRAEDQSMILAKGAVLSTSMLVRLARMGVTSVNLETDAAQTASDLEQQRAEVEARFAGHESDPYLMEMKRVVLTRLEMPDAQPDETDTHATKEHEP